MSFRLRVLALVALVGVAATAATAWLVLQQASRQVTESAEAEREDVDTITRELTEYGLVHGTWEGVPGLVEDLEVRTEQRIRLVTEYGEVVVDTDHLDGREARPVNEPPLSINPRPVLELPEGVAQPTALTLVEIETYRSGVRLAACLTRRGVGVAVVNGPHGVPRHIRHPGEPASQGVSTECREFAAGADLEQVDDVEWVAECVEPPVLDNLSQEDGFGNPPLTPSPSWSPAEPDGSLEACLSYAFADRIDYFAPLPVLVYLGAVDEEAAPPLSPGPVLAAAGLVAVVAVAGSLLVSRRVLRPIRALTAASGRLGAGDLAERVPVVGRDELAVLARSFNRMADSLQRGEERQRRLVADVAHELRTPLANLRGYLEALKDGVVSPEPELFASLHEEAVLQQRMVDDLQDLALAEAGALVYHKSRVDIGEVLETCRTAHQAVAEAAEVRLAAATTEPECYAYADPDRLRQVLGNLVSNALRATAAGGSVTLSARREGPWVTVTVADSGTGIAPEHLPSVFDRFWRADAARGRTTGGSGLGLAIARQIVTDHSGVIAVASELGVGTTFTIRLPADDHPAAPPGGASDRAAR